MIGRCQILVYEPGMTKLVPKTVSFTAFRGIGLFIDDCGNLNLSDEKRAAVRHAVRSVQKIAPDARVTVCKSLSLDGAALGGFYVRDEMGQHVMISAKYGPAGIRSIAFHESFHRCEFLLTAEEHDTLKKWVASFDEMEMPHFLKVWNGNAKRWWSNPQERMAWAFEQYVYLRNGLSGDDLPEYAHYDSFKFSTDDFPPEVIRIYEAVITGKVGQRAMPQPKREEGSVIKSAFMRFFGAEEKKKAA